MAGIVTSIQLFDRMTPVLRNIMKSMDSTLQVMKNLDKQANHGTQSKAFKQAEKDINQANNAVIKMGNNVSLLNKEASAFAAASGKINNSVSGWGRGGFNLVNLASALYLIQNIGRGIEHIMKAPDTAMSTQARLGLFNESRFTNKELYEQVYSTAMKTRTGLEETGNLSTRILISGAMKGPGAAPETMRLTEIINKALIAGGGTSEENKNALIQLSQSLASGQMQGDELRTIREQTPYLLKIMSEGLAKSNPAKFKGTTIGDMKQLGADGELTTANIIKAMLAMEKEVDAAFARMPVTFGQNMTRMGNIWKKFLVDAFSDGGGLSFFNKELTKLITKLESPAGKQFLDSIQNGISKVSMFIINVIENFDKLIPWIYGAITAFTAYKVAMFAVVQYEKLVALWANVMQRNILLVSLALGFLVIANTSSSKTLKALASAMLFGVTAYWLWTAASKAATAANYTFAASLASTGIGTLIVAIGIAVGLLVGYTNALNQAGSAGQQVMKQYTDNIKQADASNEFTKNSAYVSQLYKEFDILANKTDRTSAEYARMDFIVRELNNKIPGLNFQFDAQSAALDKLSDKLGLAVQMYIKLAAAKGMYTAYNAKIEAASSSIIDLQKQNEELSKNGNKHWTWVDIGGWAPAPAYVDTGAQDIQNNNAMIDKLTADIAGYSTNMQQLELDALNYDKNYTTQPPTDPYELREGGSLSEIGKIGSDVNIADEDLQLLRDVAAKEFLVNLSSVTPQANITFGDVKETADVNKIMDVLSDMVEDALATSLITD